MRITPDEGKREKALFKRMGGTGYPTVYTQADAAATPLKQRLTRRINKQWSVVSIAELDQLIGGLAM